MKCELFIRLIVKLFVCFLTAANSANFVAASPFGNLQTHILTIPSGSNLGKSPKDNDQLSLSVDCESQRRRSQIKKTNNPREYVPSCMKNNPLLYDTVQCHEATKSCWCVNSLTGEPLKGTVITGEPKCPLPEPTKPAKRRKKNRCKGRKRMRFLRRVVATLKTEMIMKTNMTSTRVTRDSAITWKFNQLDKNKNKLLERAEWKVYKTVLLEWRKVRQCSRNLFKTCDLDANRRLTIDEWRRCIINEINLVPAKPPQQLNPFLYVLKHE